MRYRRLSYRYAMVLRSGEPRPYGDPWRLTQARIVLAQPQWRPPTDVYELDGSIQVTIELAGVDPDELDVQLYEDAVVVEGTRRLPAIEPGGVYHSVEIRQGPFRLEVPLPSTVDLEQVDARYERGLLLISLVKQNERT
ncbi:MAG TPA: Hsp20/alpha crystallin family protein [Dehalococcoidia bacterium]|nr:Hsp20/alpha crystallin family protein [Dehalococcoidia bacterium]